MRIDNAFLVGIVMSASVCSNIAVACDEESVVPEECRPLKIECYGGDRDNFRDPDPFGSEITIRQFRIDGRAAEKQKPGPFQGHVCFYKGHRFFTDVTSYYDIRLEVPDNAWLQQRMLERVSFSSGPIVRGDIMPINGTLYIVDRCKQSEFGIHFANIALVRLQRDKWPEAIQCDEYAYAITSGGHLSVPGHEESSNLEVKWDEVNAEYQLIVGSFVVQPSGPALKFRQVAIRQARPGVQFALAGDEEIHHFQVVSVVPPKPESHIPGWVELRRVWPAIQPFGMPSSAKELDGVPPAPN